MRLPGATYRLQLGSGFQLHDAAALIPYLQQLGVTDLYLSPVLEAERGSTHGYDVTDPKCVRAEIGGDAAFAQLAKEVREAAMGVLLDIVPNHMAASTRNPWWRDLLEFGGDSLYRNWFDLSWNSLGEPERLHLPILASQLSDVLAAGEVALCLTPRGLAFAYFDHVLPLAPASYPRALQCDADADLAGLPQPLRHRATAIVAALCGLRPPVTFAQEQSAARRVRAVETRDAFLALCAEDSIFREWVLHQLDRARHSVDCAAGRQTLESLLAMQSYRMKFWKSAVREITYRRFFDITTLAGVRVEEREVFDTTHALLVDWVAAGEVTGVRVDHIDGLYDPTDYLRRLRRAAPVYTVVEKILAPDESLPFDWETEGTTGYDFANIVNGWFIEPDGWRALTVEYMRLTGDTASFDEIAYQKRKLVLDRLFGGEVAALLRELRATTLFGGATDTMLDLMLREVTAAMSVYRTYSTARKASEDDRTRLRSALAEARQRAPQVPATLFDTLAAVLLLDESGVPQGHREAAIRFVTHWQQFTGPVMAKGVEDTALYNWFPLASANDVGSEPDAPCVQTARLHEFLQSRAARTPAALNATSTHDSKRSEDVRTRTNVLAELPSDWAALLDTWRRTTDPVSALDTPMEVLLLQTLLGTWPLSGEPDDSYRERVRSYMLKAAREAKHHTSWREPDEQYEARLERRVAAVFTGEAGSELQRQAAALARKLAFPGALASLAQTLLKITAPGVPDFYQGTEQWCYTLVDPDNRRPVDFEHRVALLEALQPVLESPTASAVSELLAAWHDGRIKMFITNAGLRHRSAHRTLFDSGGYVPLEIHGPRSTNAAAFVRVGDNKWSITAVARWVAAALPADGSPPTAEFWSGTELQLPTSGPSGWRDVLSGQLLTADSGGRLPLARVFRTLPTALLYAAG